MVNSDKILEKLIDSVNLTFKRIALGKLQKGNNMQERQTYMIENQDNAAEPLPFSTPEEYRQTTGHRFRLHKEEAAQGLNRQEAFNNRLPQLILEWNQSR